MRRIKLMSALLVLAACSMLTQSARSQYVKGDVFISTQPGTVLWYSPTGTLKGTLSSGISAYITTGSCFDQDSNFYVTNFSANQVAQFDKNGNLVNADWATTDAGSHDESILVDKDGNFFVGQADGTRHVLEFSSSGGSSIASFAPATQGRGTDWDDLSADQCTLLYTSEGTEIKSFNVCTNTQNADFATLPSGGGPYSFELRIAPNKDVFVAATSAVYRFDSTGTLIGTYPTSSMLTAGGGYPSYLFALNLDPDGNSFWTADISSGDIFHIRISDGAELATWNVGSECDGLSVFGELVAASCPQVTTNPANDTAVCPSNAATFTAAASGNTTVQWQQSTDGGATWTNISGANTTTLSFTATGSENGYEYQAVFTDTTTGDHCNPVTSSAATLTATTCCTSPSVGTNPTDQAVCRGSMATFTAAATGDPTPTIQWEISTDNGATWNTISGANSSTYTTGNTTSGMNGYEYEAVFTNSCSPGTATSTIATLTVNTAAVVTSNPSDQTGCAGSQVCFTVAASGSPTPTVQWQVSTNNDGDGDNDGNHHSHSDCDHDGDRHRHHYGDHDGYRNCRDDHGSTWTNISGANSTTYCFTATTDADGKSYRAIVTNTCGTDTSCDAELDVNVAPGTPSCPSNDTVCSGNNASFTSTASGSPTPSVQWQRSTNAGTSWSNISGATSTTLRVSNAGCSSGGYEYRAVFTNTCGTSTSCAATLDVLCGNVDGKQYWHDHDGSWSSEGCTIGGHSFSHSDCLSLLNYSGSDKWECLAQEILCERLNINHNHACQSCLGSWDQDADSWCHDNWGARPVRSSDHCWSDRNKGSDHCGNLQGFNHGDDCSGKDSHDSRDDN